MRRSPGGAVGDPRPVRGSRGKGTGNPLKEPGWGGRDPSRSWGGGLLLGRGGPGALRAAGRGSRGLGGAGRRFQPDGLRARTAPWRPPPAEGTARARHVRQGVPREGQHQHQGLGPVSAAQGPRRDSRRAGGTRGARPRGRGRCRHAPVSSCFHPLLVIRSRPEHGMCVSHGRCRRN